jgi:hypothetical protein
MPNKKMSGVSLGIEIPPVLYMWPFTNNVKGECSQRKIKVFIVGRVTKVLYIVVKRLEIRCGIGEED